MEKNWRKNDISTPLEDRKKLGLFMTFTIFLGGNIFLLILWFVGEFYDPLLGIAIIEGLFGLGALGWYLINWQTRVKNPKYICWDDEGIYIRDFRDDERTLLWEKIERIEKLEEYYVSIPFLNNQLSEYGIFYKGGLGSWFFVDEEKGKKIKDKVEEMAWM